MLIDPSDRETCSACNGSGEGYASGTRCNSCKGSGSEPNSFDIEKAEIYQAALEDKWESCREERMLNDAD